MIAFTFIWDIENVKELFNENITGHPSIKSPEFCITGNGQYQFQLQLYPKGTCDGEEDHVSLYINLKSKLITKATLQYKFSIEDSNGQKFKTITSPAVTITTGSGYAKYIQREAILYSKNGLLKNGKLTILCEGEVIVGGDVLTKSELSNLNDKFSATSYAFTKAYRSGFDANRMKSIPFSTKWEIDNFQKRSQVKDYSNIETVPFSPPNENKYKFKLRLYPKGDEEKTKDHFSLFLCNESDHSKPLLVLFKLSMIDNNGQKYNTFADKVRINANSSLGWNKYFNHGDIYFRNLIQNDTLTVVFEGEIILNGDSLSGLDLENHLAIFKNKQIFKCVPISKSNNTVVATDFSNSEVIEIMQFEQRFRHMTIHRSKK